MPDLMLGPMPAIGFGTWPLKGEECTQLVAEAIAAGYRTIDTAQGYRNEADVGRGIRNAALPRDEIFIATKIWPDDLRAERIGPAMDESLDRLGLDRVDLVLLHWPSPDVPIAETLQALEAERRQGKTKLIGLSNFTARLLADAVAVGVPLFCNQVEFHPFLDQRRILEATRRAGLFLVAYSPLARGRVSESATLQAIGKRHHRTASQVALRWILQHEGVGYVAKASSLARIRENLSVTGFELLPEEMAAISALADGSRVVNLSIAPEWD